LGIDIAIETDLHEWPANRNYIYEDEETAERAYDEYVRYNGVHSSEDQEWEEAQSINERVIRVLLKYASNKKAIVACHGVMIQAVTSKLLPKNGEIVEFDLESSSLDD
jgi:uncharacterized phosphatase